MKRAVVQVLKSWRPTPTTHAVRVQRPPDFSFTAGQHAVVELETEEGPRDRFLSIASAPGQKDLEFAVRVSDSAFKRRFAALDAHDRLAVTGPLGAFVLDQHRPALLLSGGIGITPLLSMVRHISTGESAQRITLLYANREPREIAFRSDLDEIARGHHGVRVVYFVDEARAEKDATVQVGRITVEVIRQEAERLGKPICYICGPPGMVQAMRQHLGALDIQPADIRREDFIGY